MMKKANYLIASILCLLALYACSHNNPILLHAESIMEAYPDSALSLLSSIEHPQKKLNRKNFALYSLLTTQALHKTYADLTKDSLIIHAVEYYRTSKDSVRAGKSYFYAGKVAEESNNIAKALEYYLKAKDLYGNCKDYKYQFMIRLNLGKLLGRQWLREEQRQENIESLHYAKLSGNKVYEAIAHHNLGNAYLGLYMHEHAAVSQLEALEIAEEHYPALLTNIYHQLCINAIHRGDLKLAVAYADSIGKVKPPSSLTYLTKGMSFFKTNMNDSALYYFKKSIHAPDKNIRASSYIDLAEIYRSMNQLDSCLHYQDLYLATLDTIGIKFSPYVVQTLKNHKQNKLEEEYIILKERNYRSSLMLYILLVIVVFLLLLITATLFIMRTRKQQHIIEKQKLTYEKQQLVEEQEKNRIAQEMKLTSVRELCFRLVNIKAIPKLEKEDIRLTDKDWEVIFDHADKLFDGFSARLKSEYPTITTLDVRLCCLIKMKMNTEVISQIQCVEKRSVYQQKLRLAKEKMGLPDTKSLDDFIYQF